MRRPRSRSAEDGDTVAVFLVDEGAPDGIELLDVTAQPDDSDDEFLALLHELALEAIALRASAPGNPRDEPVRPAPLADEPASAARRLWGLCVAGWRWWRAAAE